jgi:hypothetical protein
MKAQLAEVTDAPQKANADMEVRTWHVLYIHIVYALACLLSLSFSFRSRASGYVMVFLLAIEVSNR